MTEPIEPKEILYRTIAYTYDQYGKLIQESHIKYEEPEEAEEEKPSEYDGIVGWNAVDHNDVDDFLRDGYHIVQHYQKYCLMAKREVNETE
jgi:hypothetical protein